MAYHGYLRALDPVVVDCNLSGGPPIVVKDCAVLGGGRMAAVSPQYSQGCSYGVQMAWKKVVSQEAVLRLSCAVGTRRRSLVKDGSAVTKMCCCWHEKAGVSQRW